MLFILYMYKLRNKSDQINSAMKIGEHRARLGLVEMNSFMIALSRRLSVCSLYICSVMAWSSLAWPMLLFSSDFSLFRIEKDLLLWALVA